jgi:hypothetical protein
VAVLKDKDRATIGPAGPKYTFAFHLKSIYFGKASNKYRT